MPSGVHLAEHVKAFLDKWQGVADQMSDVPKEKKDRQLVTAIPVVTRPTEFPSLHFEPSYTGSRDEGCTRLGQVDVGLCGALAVRQLVVHLSSSDNLYNWMTVQWTESMFPCERFSENLHTMCRLGFGAERANRMAQPICLLVDDYVRKRGKGRGIGTMRIVIEGVTNEEQKCIEQGSGEFRAKHPDHSGHMGRKIQETECICEEDGEKRAKAKLDRGWWLETEAVPGPCRICEHFLWVLMSFLALIGLQLNSSTTTGYTEAVAYASYLRYQINRDE